MSSLLNVEAVKPVMPFFGNESFFIVYWMFQLLCFYECSFQLMEWTDATFKKSNFFFIVIIELHNSCSYL